MRRAQTVVRAGDWPRERCSGTVTLAYDARHRRRLLLTSDAGEEFLLDLVRPVALAEGDGLALSDGGWIEVKAAAEPLLEIRGAPRLIARLAWHLGNRHLPADLSGERILIREDPVIATLLAGLGATLRPVLAPFTPERGAYDDGAQEPHSHHHHHDHDDHHHHDHGHGHEPDA